MKFSNKFKCLLAMPLLALASNAVHAQEPIVLKFSHLTSANSRLQQHVVEPWCNAIEKDSGGRLKCQIYPSMQLGGTPAQLVDQVKNGVADVVWTAPGYTTGRFPRTEALEMPFTLPPTAVGGTNAMWEFTEKYAKDDYKDYELLALWSSSNLIISTTDKPTLTVESFKGLKLRSPSRFTSLFLTALGATPVTMPTGAITEALSKGLVDGAMSSWEIIPTIKADEYTKYHMEGPATLPGFSQTPVVMLMNKGRYNSLPDDLKAVVDKNSGAVLVEMAAKVWEKGNEEAKNQMIANGHKALTIKNSDYTAMANVTTAAVEKEWIKQANARGLDGNKLIAEVRAIGKKHLPK